VHRVVEEVQLGLGQKGDEAVCGSIRHQSDVRHLPGTSK
jgi:hypothetical protein